MRTLILNVDGSPLHICDARRALLLILDQTADTIVDSDKVVHSQHLSFTLPSVVQLRRYIHVPHGRSIPLTTRTVVARDRGYCAYCGLPNAETMDHIVPRAHGGAHTWENVVASCGRCNRKKRDRTPEQAKMKLLHEPSRPRGANARLLLYALDPAWEPYLLQAS